MFKKNYLIMISALSLISGIAGFTLTSLYLNPNLSTVAQTSTTNLNTSKELPCDNCVYVTKSIEVNKQNSPILNTSIYSKGKLLKKFEAVSGRNYTQELDRNIAGNKSPSPNGNYVIGKLTKGYLVETGGVFIPYTPLFITERSSLGFHLDPSWGLDNGENGTEGCIAFKNLKEFNDFNYIITYNNIDKLIVNF